MERKGKLSSNIDDEMRQVLAEFMVEVLKFEELATVGRRFLTEFLQAIEFLRRCSIHESSELVQSIIRANETKRVKSYVQTGCTNDYDSKQNVSQLSRSLCGLKGCLAKGRGILYELENLVNKVDSSLQAALINSDDQIDMHCQFSPEVTREEIIWPNDNSHATSCVSFIAVIHSMLKQDYDMQENIVSSLSLKSSSGELEGYCLMWTLRPFIKDEIIHQALKQVR